jgi:hypothetical protein
MNSILVGGSNIGILAIISALAKVASDKPQASSLFFLNLSRYRRAE